MVWGSPRVAPLAPSKLARMIPAGLLTWSSSAVRILFHRRRASASAPAAAEPCMALSRAAKDSKPPACRPSRQA
jgi:hypothetical protein